MLSFGVFRSPVFLQVLAKSRCFLIYGGVMCVRRL